MTVVSRRLWTILLLLWSLVAWAGQPDVPARAIASLTLSHWASAAASPFCGRRFWRPGSAINRISRVLIPAMTDEIHQHFHSLGLKPSATAGEARRAYRDMVMVWHPFLPTFL